MNKKTMFSLSIVLLLFSSLALVSATENPSITLSPTQGSSVVMVYGQDFYRQETLIVCYDGVPQSTIPTKIVTGDDESFTALITIPDVLAVGTHTITVTNYTNDTATATFTVLDIKGAKGQDALSFNATGNVIIHDGINGTTTIQYVNTTTVTTMPFNSTGNIIIQNGTNGKDGANGYIGRDGANGVTTTVIQNSVITVGTTTPTIASAKIGDLFLDSNDYSLYQLKVDGWQIIGNIKGSQGDAGLGTQGVAGAKGDKGDSLGSLELLMILMLIATVFIMSTIITIASRRRKLETIKTY